MEAWSDRAEIRWKHGVIERDQMEAWSDRRETRWKHGVIGQRLDGSME